MEAVNEGIDYIISNIGVARLLVFTSRKQFARTLSQNYEVERLAKLAAKMPRSRVCFTLTIGGNQFELEDASQHGLGAPARHTKDVSYADVIIHTLM